jgi:dUTP pyrophosphatase
MIALHNSTDGYERIMVGEKIAQLILIPTVNFKTEEVDELVSADERGTGGFGSTGT